MNIQPQSQPGLEMSIPWHKQFWFAVVVWFFGAWPRDLWLLPPRRWFVWLAFESHYRGWMRVSSFMWRCARAFAMNKTQPAIAAYSTRLLMGEIIGGREQ